MGPHCGIVMVMLDSVGSGVIPHVGVLHGQEQSFEKFYSWNRLDSEPVPKVHGERAPELTLTQGPHRRGFTENTDYCK